MVDTAKARFPEPMFRAAQSHQGVELETYALDALDRLKQYARDEPISFGLWALGIGFVLGWRLKPW